MFAARGTGLGDLPGNEGDGLAAHAVGRVCLCVSA